MEMAIKNTESMDDLLDWFNDQPCPCSTVARAAHETGYSRQTIRNNLKQLSAGDYAINLYESTGEYWLKEDPRTNE